MCVFEAGFTEWKNNFQNSEDRELYIQDIQAKS